MAAIVAISTSGRYDSQYYRNRFQHPHVPESKEEGRGQSVPDVVSVQTVEREKEKFVRVLSHAPLVAQLAATRDNVPQTRQLRRTDSASGAASYQQTAKVMTRSHAPLPSWDV
jgi:hypothetical protein